MPTVSDKIFFRPTEYDLQILAEIQAANPQLATASDLMRAALRGWQMRRDDVEELKKRVEKLEAALIDKH